jgi:hypothetical protein
MAPKFDAIRAALGLTPGRAEAFAQGGTLGFSDELGAALQALAAKASGTGDFGPTYRQARSENQQIYDREREEEPKTAMALELAGSLPLLAASPIGKEAVTAAEDLGLAARTGGAALSSGVGAAMRSAIPLGFAASLGHSRADASTPEGAFQQQTDLLGGTGLSSLTAGALRLGGNALTRSPETAEFLKDAHRRFLQSKIAKVNADNPFGHVAEDAEGKFFIKGATQSIEEPRSPVSAEEMDRLVLQGKPKPAPVETPRSTAQTVAEHLRGLLGEEEE